MDNRTIDKKVKDSEQMLRGVDVDIADNDKVSKKLVDEATCYLNNNHAGDNDLQKS